MKKENPLNSRGIRFSNELWDRVCKEAAKDKTNRTYPSDVVRHAVGMFLDLQDSRRGD